MSQIEHGIDYTTTLSSHLLPFTDNFTVWPQGHRTTLSSTLHHGEEGKKRKQKV